VEPATVLIASFEVQVARPGISRPRAEERRVRRPRFKPHVDDLAALLLALAGAAPGKLVIEADDGRPGGWSHREFGRALGVAVGTRPLIMSSPALFLRLAARADQMVRGPRAKLTADRAAYFSHRDWVVDPKLGAPADLWRPRIETLEGLRQTAQWYKAQGWL